MNNKLTSTNQSVMKTFQIIEVMTAERKPMKLQDIAARCDIPASTALRLVHTMETCGYASQNPDTLCYSLTLKFTHIGNMVRDSLSLYQIVHPHVDQLAQRCRANVNVTVESDAQVLYVDVVDSSDSPIKVSHTIGQRYPLYSTASGKIMLSGYGDKQLQKYLAETELRSYTPKTISNKQALAEEIRAVKARGHSYNDEEGALGMRCVAVPIYGYGGEIAASLSVSGTIYQMSYEYMETLVPILKQEADLISRQLAMPELASSQ